MEVELDREAINLLQLDISADTVRWSICRAPKLRLKGENIS